MGIFSKLFGGDNQAQSTNVAPVMPVTPVGEPVDVPSVGPLDLRKGDILDLTKYSTSLTKVRAAAGWDVNKGFGHDYDLDLCAYLMNGTKLEKTVYYGSKEFKGIYLDGDNLTGEGDGDDENIFVELPRIPNNIDRIIFAVVIYEAASRHQSFKHVKNAYMRLIDESNGKEICRFRLTEDGGSATAATLATLEKNNGNWSFRAIGEYSSDTISSLSHKI